MARVARDSNIAVLFPNGEASLHEVSSELLTAFQHANTILSWYENLPSDEMPDPWMWPFSDEIDQHFEEVKIAREHRYGNNDDDDDWDDWGSVKNEFSRD